MKSILLAVAFAASSPVAAQETTPGPESTTPAATIKADPDQIAKLLTDEGYRAKVETEKDGQRYITSASSGRNFTVYFMGCNGGVKLGSCSSIEYYTGFTTGKPYPTDRTNEWNAKNRYGRAYVDGDQDPVIEFDLFLGDTGMPREMFIENLDIWTDIMADFDRFVFEVKTNAKKK